MPHKHGSLSVANGLLATRGDFSAGTTIEPRFRIGETVDWAATERALQEFADDRSRLRSPEAANWFAKRFARQVAKVVPR
ncbi:MAG: hypothetical protein HKN47_05200 [Pirellulaceae bacterium]|nr:hypothetical protein [Pirellulaceae bacterium]